MELKEWIYSNHKKIYQGDLVWRTHARGLHVNGECQDCFHVRHLPTFPDDNPLFCPVLNTYPGPEFGCRHWRPKDV